jgi:hypothetical protein
MILTDLMEYVGKRVRVYLLDGRVLEGILKYVPAYSEMYNYRKAKHFYISLPDGEWDFRAYHVDKVVEL